MSRIAKNPVAIPSGVEVKLADNEIVVKGKLGELKQSINSELVEIKNDNGQITFAVKNDVYSARTSDNARARSSSDAADSAAN